VTLKTLLEKHREAVILTHRYADVDATASSIALKKLLEDLFGYKSVTLASWEGPSKVALELLEKLNLAIDWKIANELEAPSLLLLVDVASQHQLGGFSKVLKEALKRSSSIVLVDHHAHSKVATYASVMLYEPRCSSSSEILALTLPSRFVSSDEGISCLLLAGIIADTSRYARASETTFLASYRLSVSCRYSYITGLMARNEEISERLARLKGLQRSVIRKKNGIVVVATYVSSYEGQVASSIVSLGADIALVVTRKDEESKITYRFSHRINDETAKKIIDKIVKREKVKSWGGHLRAGAILLDYSLNKRELSKYVKSLAEHVVDGL